jgi:hypothetical protein
MIVKNAGNQTANQKKALKVRIISGHKKSSLNPFRAASIYVGSKQNGKFELYLSLSIRNSNAY